MVKIPFGIAKASSTDVPDLTSLCECGGSVGYLEDSEGNRIECQDCGEHYNWWNSVPSKGFMFNDEIIPLDADEVDQARADPPVNIGNVEKVVPVKRMLLHYNVEGNYYLTPEDEHRDQYGVLVGVLNEQDWAILTYLQLRSKTKRYAIVSEGGVLMAFQLQDKKALPDLEYGTDEMMEEQAADMLEGLVQDEPALEDVEGKGLKEMVRQKVNEQAPEPEDADIATQV